MTTLLRGYLLLPAFVVLGAWTEPPRTLPPVAVACVVVHVVDGDTLDCLNGPRVRVRGVDTPERGEPRYHEATQELARRVLGREVALLPHHRSRGRTVADVVADGINVGRAMDAAGWSKPVGARR